MHKYTDLVMKFSAMVGNELVLEREEKNYSQNGSENFYFAKRSNYS